MPNTIRILYLQEYSARTERVHYFLAGEGIKHEVTNVGSEEEFATAVERREIDLIFSDSEVRNSQGAAALRIARAKRPELPFLLLSHLDAGLVFEMVQGAEARDDVSYFVNPRLLAESILRAREEARHRDQKTRHWIWPTKATKR